jgi:diketogulonate reductase-like aldo/keto reductase
MTPRSAPRIDLPTVGTLPKLGLGTWYMGESRGAFADEVAAVRHAIARGIRLIDTAEMYASGGAEQVVGEAIAGCGVARDDLFLVSKVLPSNAGYDRTIRACEASLKRMGTDYVDLYLLHWRGGTPFEETLRAFADLKDAGKIRHAGVSNFDAADMNEWRDSGGEWASACNQILYNLSRRGPEWDLIPDCRDNGVPVMAYSPLEQGRLAGDSALAEVARRHGVQPLQIALAWVLAQPDVVAIPKSARPAHIDANVAALEIVLDADDHAVLDAAFPPPTGPSPLEML